MAAFSFQSLYDGIANDGNIAHRVEVAVVKAALDIFAAESGTPTKRTALATAVAANPDATIFAGGVTPTDAQSTVAGT